MINEPKYDGEYTTKSYVDRQAGELEDTVTKAQKELQSTVSTINKTYGAAPNPPYYVGNLYVDGTNLYRCKTERLIGSFNAADWELATAYPTSSYVDSTYTKPSDFLVTGTVNVDGGRITAGSISSSHYVPNTTGMKINLDNDTLDSKHFKVSDEGVITATNANLSGTLTSNNVNITGGALNIGSGNFVVNNAGVVTAKSLTMTGTISSSSITGGNINIGNGSFTVDSVGNLVATKANINGVVNATSGSFNGAVYASSGTFTGSISSSSFSGGSISISAWNPSAGRTSYFNMGLSTSDPNVSGLNVGAGGIHFAAGKGINLSGRQFTFSSADLMQVDSVHRESNGDLLIQNDYNGGELRINNSTRIKGKGGAYVEVGSNVSLQGGYTLIQNLSIAGSTITGGNGGYMYANSNCLLAPVNTNYYAYIRSVSPGNKIAVSSGGPSSRNVKENIKSLNKKI